MYTVNLLEMSLDDCAHKILQQTQIVYNRQLWSIVTLILTITNKTLPSPITLAQT